MTLASAIDPPSAAGAVPEPAVAQREIVEALRHPSAYGAGCSAVEVVETHISYVFLTGRFAYKVKKAIRLPFLDFSSLDARRRYCELEVTLNRRTARTLYLDVVPIVSSGGRYAVGGDGPVVEWAVRMVQFDQEALLSRLLQRGALEERHVDSLADRVAAFHESAARDGRASPFSSAEHARHLAFDNFAVLRAARDDDAWQRDVDALRTWTVREYAKRETVMQDRLRDGFVRACHGDLHLGNVVLIDGVATPFDCIEFDAALRWSDVMSDVAFVAMDLRARGRPDLARRFLNRYLEHTGDYGGVPVLQFHLVYRAVVRAKVGCIRAAQVTTGEERLRVLREADDYVQLAKALAQPLSPCIIAMHGFSGCGKSTLSQALVEATDAIRLRTDVERKRCYGLGAAARSGSAIDRGIYTSDATRAVYRHVAELADVVRSGGYPVVVDATFLQRWQRDLFRATARHAGVPFIVVDVAAPEQTLRQRIAQRTLEARDVSEAGTAVLEHQLASHDPLDAAERAFTITIDGALAPREAAQSKEWQRLVATVQSARLLPRPDAQPVSTTDKVRFLSHPSSYPSCTRVDVVETHLSWIFLTDAHAWKLKKPLRQKGIDLVASDARRHNAERELRLNRRLSSNVYLDVVPLVIADGALALGGAGDAVDWLVQMRRLPASRMLDTMIRDRTVRVADVSALVRRLASYYRGAAVPVLSAGEYRRRLQETIGETHTTLCWPSYALDRTRIDRIAARLQRCLDRHAGLLDERVRRGRVVEAHGDLRPEHVCIEDMPQFIDCLDFDADLRVQDVADELGFLALECERLGAPALREAIFAALDESMDDAPADALVHFYQAYRAFIRMYLAIRHLDDLAVREPDHWRAQAGHYLRLAEAHVDRCE